MSWVILQHVAWEGPGLIAAEARSRGLQFEILRLDTGVLLPSFERVNGLVVMGGPMGIYETNKFPFLTQEVRLIENLIRRSRPVLGVCLGAQLLAHALGARVFRGKEPEIGFGSVELTQEGTKDVVVGASGPLLPVFHWHGDTFDLPLGTSLLASSVAYPNQAFRYGTSAYGLQFHVEPDQNLWTAWRDHLPNGVMNASQAKRNRIEQVGRTLIRNFFDLVVALTEDKCLGRYG